DADLVLFIYREDEVNPTQENRGWLRSSSASSATVPLENSSSPSSSSSPNLPTSGRSPSPAMRPPDPGRPTWAEIDLGALLHNYRTLCGLLDCSLQIADGGLAIEGTASGPNPKSAIRNPQSEIPNPQSAIGSPRVIPVIKANA